jgi:hypothetical protein
MKSSSFRTRFLAVAIPLSLTLAACGGGHVDAPGRSVGEVAYPTPVLLRDGTTSTIAEIANGEPLLLYFFATW